MEWTSTEYDLGREVPVTTLKSRYYLLQSGQVLLCKSLQVFKLFMHSFAMNFCKLNDMCRVSMLLIIHFACSHRVDFSGVIK